MSAKQIANQLRTITAKYKLAKASGQDTTDLVVQAAKEMRLSPALARKCMDKSN